MPPDLVVSPKDDLVLERVSLETSNDPDGYDSLISFADDIYSTFLFQIIGPNGRDEPYPLVCCGHFLFRRFALRLILLTNKQLQRLSTFERWLNH